MLLRSACPSYAFHCCCAANKVRIQEIPPKQQRLRHCKIVRWSGAPPADHIHEQAVMMPSPRLHCIVLKSPALSVAQRHGLQVHSSAPHIVSHHFFLFRSTLTIWFPRGAAAAAEAAHYRYASTLLVLLTLWFWKFAVGSRGTARSRSVAEFRPKYKGTLLLREFGLDAHNQAGIESALSDVFSHTKPSTRARNTTHTKHHTHTKHLTHKYSHTQAKSSAQLRCRDGVDRHAHAFLCQTTVAYPIL